MATQQIIGGVSPHAGYDFSLPHAVHLFSLLETSEAQWDNILLLNPNHTGRGAPLSLDSHSQWNTPLGNVDINDDLRQGILSSPGGSTLFTCESRAQQGEHSAEVIVPLLSYFLGDYSLLPLCMGPVDFTTAQRVAQILFEVLSQREDNTLLLASSDFTHFKSVQEGKALDDYALEALLAFDTNSFYERVKERAISICGYGPIMVLWEYAKLVTPQLKAKILRRGHSGESDLYDHEPLEVVDYVSLLVYRDIR